MTTIERQIVYDDLLRHDHALHDIKRGNQREIEANRVKQWRGR